MAEQQKREAKEASKKNDKNCSTSLMKWIFRGNMVVPTGNPFDADMVEKYNKQQYQAETSKDDDDNDNNSSSCQWLGPGLQLLLDHVLTVDHSGIIRHLGPAETFFSDTHNKGGGDDNATTEKTIQLSSRTEFLCPGLIDLHIHAPQYSYAGTATDRPLLQWLETYTFPAERRLRDNIEWTRSVYSRVVQTTLRHGTTTAVYFATLDVAPCRALVDCAVAAGQRALIGKVCMDRHSPDDYCQSLEQNVRETETLIQYIYQTCGRRRRRKRRKHHEVTDSAAATAADADADDNVEQPPVPLPLVLPLITPRFIPTCTPQLLSALGALAAQHDCHVTSHISESADEVAWSRQLDASDNNNNGVGRTDAAIFDSHQLLTDQCIMAHGVHLLLDDDETDDCDLLKQRGTAIAHCPLSNFFFAGNTLPCRQLLQRGNLVGLGTDVAGGYSPSMWHSSRMAVVASHALQQQQQQQQQQKQDSQAKVDADEDSPATTIIDYRHAFYLATLGGAEALGLQNHIGTFAVGMEFDALVLSANPDETSSPVDVFETDSVADVFQKLCVLGDDRNVKRVFVQGVDVTISK